MKPNSTKLKLNGFKMKLNGFKLKLKKFQVGTMISQNKKFQLETF